MRLIGLMNSTAGSIAWLSLILLENNNGLNTAPGLGVTTPVKPLSTANGTWGVSVMDGVSVIVAVRLIVGVRLMVWVNVIVGVSVTVGDGGKAW
jgi:hypothetical protein